MSSLFHTLCFADLEQYTHNVNWTGGAGLHRVDENCWCAPDLEISTPADSIVVRHRCNSTHTTLHHWLAVLVGELPLDGDGFIQIPGTGE